MLLQVYGSRRRRPGDGVAVQLDVWSETARGWQPLQPPVPAANSSASGVSVVLPASSAQPLRAMRASVAGGAPKAFNVPEIWWVLGDGGNWSTNAGGGWVRLFGRSIHLSARAGTAAGSAAGQLRLIHAADGAVTLLPLDSGFAHNGPYTARFWIPAGLAPGLYDLACSNGLAPSHFEPMPPWFETPANPARPGQLLVTPPPRAAWPQKVFVVRNEQQRGHPPPSAGQTTAAIQEQIDAARAAGGGVVYLPPGAYSVVGGIVLPASTVLKGAGANATWLTFEAQNVAEAPAAGYITSNMSGGWGVEDLTVYTSSAGYYHSIFNLQKIHAGVTIRRVVVRANPFHSQEAFCVSGRANPPQVCNFSWFGGRSPAVLLDGVSSFEVSDCDMYSAWISIGNGHFTTNASYGLVARNTLYSGNAAHWFNQVHQVAWEDNVWVGVAMQAFGSNIATYNGGFSQNLYFARSRYSFSYGGDREMMTLDTLQAYYFGPVQGSATGAPTVTLAPCASASAGASGAAPCVPTTSGQDVLGGVVSVMNGTGAGQARRIVAWVATCGAGGHSGLCPTIELDQPFEPPLDATSYVSISPYRGRVIWDTVHQQDGGHFQLYGAASDWVIHGVVHQRLGGIMGEGGGAWFEPNHRIEITDCFVESHWGSNGFIDGGGVCGTGNCSMMAFWVLRRNGGSFGAAIGVAGYNTVTEFNYGYSCCADPARGCQAGASAGVSDAVPPASAHLQNNVARGNRNINSCPTVPTGPE